MVTLDVDFVRSQFPAFAHPETGRWAHLENAGGSYAAGQVIDVLHHFFVATKVQPYWDFGPSAEAGRSMDRAREFDTPLGRFSFTRVPQKTFYAAVDRAENDQGGSFLVASPLKALADYVYAHKCDWTSARPVVESLRVDESSLAGIPAEEFDVLAGNYTSQRVRRFLKGLRKELGK